MPSPATLSVDLGALARNFHALQALTGAPVHPVVKADGYGLGAPACATRLMAEGARTFFVARAAEGQALRAALGAEPTIYVLDGCHEGAAAELKAADLRPVLNQPRQIDAWRQAGGGACGLQIDTGMNRLGFRPEDAPETFDGVSLVMSHLACADEPAQPMNRRQRDLFAAAAQRYPGAIRSFANSGGCFLGPDFAFDAVRPGICLYGGGPEGRTDDRIAPVATLWAEVLQVREVPAGESVGYSRGFRADAPVRVATVAAGYADGLLRSYSPRGAAWVAGQTRPLLGRVSMDVCAVDVTGLDVAVGDRVELFGPNRRLDDAAAAAGTIAYELLTSITPRVPRAYVD
ncbi:MAG: alanine racemase [Brevundimonas sp.]|uniref:Alanine racemase n=1 Tax=Brevundimonas albigilva TaxID=1312364 RepID=A0ABY4SG66_9CAUL|nr:MULTISPECIES: alanine racemase [Brevundimonas]PZU57261.1 MAG: alanine racemase [Brevundimonas sp.]URI14022.1 alanine racemase [Brevundimonas albigilva]